MHPPAPASEPSCSSPSNFPRCHLPWNCCPVFTAPDIACHCQRTSWASDSLTPRPPPALGLLPALRKAPIPSLPVPCSLSVSVNMGAFWHRSRFPSLPPPRTLADVGSWRTGLLPRGEEKRKMCFGSSPKPLHAVHGASPCDLTRNAAGWPPDPQKSLQRQPCGSRPACRPGAAAVACPARPAMFLAHKGSGILCAAAARGRAIDTG